MLLSNNKTGTTVNSYTGQGVQPVVQAQLAANLNSKTLVLGNTNVVSDTLGTGNWKFYVASGNSIASITSESVSTEWTGGSILPYALPLTLPTDTAIWSPFTTTVYDSVGNYSGILVNGATIAVDGNSRVVGQGYLSLTNSSTTTLGTYFKFTPFGVVNTGLSFSFWGKFSTSTPYGGLGGGRIFDIRDAGGREISLQRGGDTLAFYFYVSEAGVIFNTPNIIDDVWRHFAITIEYSGTGGATSTYKFYVNGSLISTVPNKAYPSLGFRNHYNISTYADTGTYGMVGGIDDFQIFNRAITLAEVGNIYGNTSPPTNMIVSYNFNAVGIHSVILANGATIATDNSPGPGQGYLSLTAASSHHAILPSITFSSNTGLTFACWFRSNGTGTFGRLMDLGSYYPDINNNIIFFISGNDVCVNVRLNNSGTTYQTVTTGINFNDNVWRHVVWTISPTGIWNVYVNGAINVSNYTGVYPLLTTRTSNFIGKSNWLPIGDPYFNGGIDDFRYYNRAITADEVSLIYSQASIYYPFNVADINTSVATQVGEYSTGSYVYNGTLVNGATIAVDGNSRVSGQGYLSLLSSTTQYVNLTSSISTGANGLSFAFWYRLDTATRNNQRFFCFSNGFQTQEIMMGVHAGNAKFIINANTTDTPILSTIYNNNTWNHVVWTITPTSTTSTWRIYLNGVLTETLLEKQYPPVLSKRTNNWIGRAWYTGSADANYNGGIDDFRFYNRVITDNEATAIYVDQRPSSLKDTVTGATWMPTSAIPVDVSETSYTVKSTEIALTPGNNSTYAVWTAPKTTNLKIDVSFADYHSRSAGVGFQMFKINADNTFGSVIFPRTVTSAALTNANSTNYLSVPSRTISVSPGDKIFYRIDANGNTAAASSVLATNIYTDSNYVPVPNSTNINEIKVVQAQLATNLTNTTLVLGNTNAVSDTLGTGNWKFYVSPSTSIESITSASASTEWTGGSLLSYTDIDYYMFYPFNTNAVSGNTLLNLATNTYDATLYGNASIINTVPSPAIKPTSTGSGYLSMNPATQYVEMNQPILLNVSECTFAFWFRWNNAVSNTPLFSFDDETNYFVFYMRDYDWGVFAYKTPSGTNTGYFFYRGSLAIGEWVHFAFKSSTGSMYLNGIYNGSVSYNNPVTLFQPTHFYLGNANSSIIPVTDLSIKQGTIDIDNFILYNKSLTDIEIGGLYTQSNIHYTFDSDSISGGTSVGSKVSGTYVYNATLENGASIGTTNPSPASTSGTGHLLLTSTNAIATNPHVRLTYEPTFFYQQNWFSVAFWARSNSTLGSSAKITFFDFANSIAASENANYSFSMYLQSNAVRAKISYGASGTSDALIYTDPNILTDNVWRHYAWTIDSDGKWYFYINSVLVFTKTGGGKPIDYAPPAIYYTTCFIGRDAGSWQTASFSGAIDEFRWYKSRTLSQSEVSSLYSSQAYVGQSGKFQNSSGSSWMSKPAIPIDVSETSYTVKSTEIALTPGNNSTYAVWTAPKTTNIRVDVSFADYHTRSAGVGFQMFKINADNTFGSTIFPRAVTSTTLTNAAPTNYLSVPSRTISVSTGDKIFYRIDANGNTTAASSVLATNIYVDPNYIPVPNSTNINEIKVTQAQLATNLNSATLVSGNVNTVLDTVGTGNWKFYVAPTTSIEAITSASASTEWTGGSILSYAFLSTLPTDMALHFTFNTNAVSGTTVSSTVGGYTGTLVNGATIATDGSPAPGGGYLSLTKASGQYINFAPFNILANGITVTTWFRATSNNSYGRIYDLRLAGATSEFSLNVTSPSGIGLNGSSSPVYTTNVCDNVWRHLAITVQYAGVGGASSIYKLYINGVLQTLFNSQTFLTAGYPSTESRPICNIGTSDNIGSANYIGAFDGGIDDFRIYQRTITAEEVSLIYSQASIYYPFELADISLSAPTKIGDLATGSYVYNGTLVATSPNIATIAVDANSRVSGKGYLSLTRTNAYFKFAPFNVLNTGLTISFWGRFASTVIDGGRILDMRDPEISLQRIGGGSFKLYVTGPNDVFNSPTDMFNNVWRHFVVTIAYGGASGATSTYTLYINGSVTTSTTKQYPALGARNYYNIGTYADVNNSYGIDGGMDDFRVYQRAISAFEVSALYAGTQPSALKDTVTGATWMPTSATTVDDNETSYTVKSNEIALKPGTNSTYAIWTSPKTTNIRVDVSFADYHTRSNGVGFQMFKINSDNTFGSTIFPRTVTSAVLTDSSANYLTVPSTSLSVSTGDKVVYRIDGNGNPTSSSSVLATNIYSYSGIWN